MDIRSDESVLLLHLLEAADVHILADNCDLSGQSLLHSHGAVLLPGLSHKCINVSCAGIYCLCRNICNKRLELSVLSYEVCLRINLNDYGLLVIIYKLGCYLCCNTACLLLGACKSLLSQPVDGCFHISIRFGQGFFTVHNAGAGCLS